MPYVKVTKAKARKLLAEAYAKCQKVYFGQPGNMGSIMRTQDIMAIEKILTKCINRAK